MTKKAEQQELVPAVKAETKRPDTPIDNSPAELLRIAVSGGADVDKLEKLMDLQQRWEAEQGRKAFFESMNRVQQAIEPIVRDAKNTQTNSMYARMETIHKKLCPLYTAEGFSIAFAEGDAKRDGEIRVTADVMHARGHQQQYHVDLNLDDVGIKGSPNKTKVHAKGSTFSYGRRYLETMIFNIALVGEDDDGNQGGVEVVTMEQAVTLGELCEAAGRDTAKLCAAVGCKELGQFPAKVYDYWVKLLKKAADEAQGK